MPNMLGHTCRWIRRLAMVLVFAGPLAILQSPAHGQQIRRVCATSCGWGSVYTDLLDALDDAQPNDQIWVAAGTYIPTGCTGMHPLECSFELRTGVELYGNFCGNEPDDEVSIRNVLNDQCITILSGEFNVGSEDGRVLHVVRADGSGLHYIDGFTITRGWARGWVEVDEFEGPTGAAIDSAGGGLLSTSDNISIVLCRFTDNLAGGSVCWNTSLFTFEGVGGGVYLGRPSEGSSAWIHNSQFDENEARLGIMAYGFYSGPQGGGLFAQASQTEVMNSIFRNNRAFNELLDACGDSYGGGHAQGGAIAVGGGCGSGFPSSLTLWNSVIYGNRAQTSGSFGGDAWEARGGGVFAGTRSNVIIRNTILRENEIVSAAGTSDDQLHEWDVAIGCLIAGNLDVAYSNIQGGWGTGNITADPQFVNASAGNFRLTSSSPCIDAGTETVVLPENIFDIAKTGLTQLPVPDFDLRQRVIGCKVDMGAFEYPTPTSSPGPADLNGDCCVDFQDLLILLSTWGPCPASACPADFNNDGEVNLADLLVLLNAYADGEGCDPEILPIETVDDCFERIGLENIEALAACIEAMMTQE